MWYRSIRRTSIIPASVAVLALIACGDKRSEKSPGGGVPPTAAIGAVSNIHLVADAAGGEWRMPAGDYGNLRYSTLDALNTSNVKSLRVITTFSTGIPNGHEGQPLVFNNTMYVVTPYPNNLMAIDLANPTGPVKFVYEPHPDPR